MFIIKHNFDTFLTQIAHALYRLMAKNLRGYESAEPEMLYKEFVHGWGRIYNYEDKIIGGSKQKEVHRLLD